MDVKYINPFITSATSVFSTMLDCEIKRKSVALKDDSAPTFEITSVIGLSGKVSGSVVFSLSRSMALKIVEEFVGIEANEINAEVVDAVGEITNMIAGGAKAGLAEFDLSLGLPNVIVGRNHTIFFPCAVRPLLIEFDSPWGLMSLEVGLDFSSIDTESASANSELVAAAN